MSFIGYEQELYSYDKYGDCKIFCVHEEPKYYFQIMFNGTQVHQLSAYKYELGLKLCKTWVDNNED